MIDLDQEELLQEFIILTFVNAFASHRLILWMTGFIYKSNIIIF